MPRPSKIAKQEQATPNGVLAELVAAIEMEAAEWHEVGKGTRLAYEAGGRKLTEGWDMGTARKKTRYVMRAAGLWVMRRDLRRKMREAKALQKNGITGQEFWMVREAMWAEKVKEAGKLLERIQAFQRLPWSQIDDPKAHYLEANHKKKPATDAELSAFYAVASRSQFRDAFLVAEFSGCRGEELGEGVRVEAFRKGPEPTDLALRFFINSAKCDQAKKGLDLRCVEVPFPLGASKEVQRRWSALAKLAAERKAGAVVRVEPTAKATSGVRFTQACRNTAKAAGVDVSAYSLRHRFSAQIKAANPGDAECVALALGHQSTKTQGHYARATRGKGGISPVQAVGVKVAGMQQVRGPKTRAGPPLHIKERVILAASVPSASSPSARATRNRL